MINLRINRVENRHKIVDFCAIFITSASPEDLAEYYKQRATLFYEKSIKVSQNWLNYFQSKGISSLDVLDDVNQIEKYTQSNDQSMLAIKW